jgi:hypothetical protein
VFLVRPAAAEADFDAIDASVAGLLLRSGTLATGEWSESSRD